MEDIREQILELLNSDNLEIQKIGNILLEITKSQNNETSNDEIIDIKSNRKWSLRNKKEIDIKQYNDNKNYEGIVW